MELPDILDARSVAAWLSDALACLQRRGVSQRQFARDSGIKLGTLSHVLKGSRKLDPAHIPKVAALLELDPFEAGVLESMVALERSDDNRARYDLSGRQRMLRAHRLGAADTGFLERWSTAAIRELMRLEGWRPDPAWIAARLRPRITEEEARDALALLESSRAAISDTDEIVSTGLQAPSGVAPDWHTQVLDAARQGLVLPREQRFFQSYIAAVTPQAAPRLIDAISRFIDEVAGICEDSAGVPRDRLVQVSVQLLPLFDPGEGDGLLVGPADAGAPDPEG